MRRFPSRLRPLFPVAKAGYTWTTRTLAPVTIRLSKRRGGYLPTTTAPTMERAAELGGGCCVTARGPDTIHRALPAGGSPPDHPEFVANLREDVPRVAVVELPGGRVLGPHGAAITGNGVLVHETSRYFGTTRPLEHPVFLHPFAAPPLDVDERVCSLASRGDGNYYHFLMDVVPRLALLAQCPGLEQPQSYYVAAQTRFQRELLDAVGITEELRIDRMSEPHIRARCLIVPGPPTMTVVNPPWVVAHLRQRLLPPDVGRVPGRRIFVGRGSVVNNRGIVNDADVRDVLAARGFEFVDAGAMSVHEQITAFAEASVIVAPHGAALANTVFASPGAQLLELFPAGGVVADYWKMACGVPGFRYHYLEGVGEPVSFAWGRGDMLTSDIEIDVRALRALLDGMNELTTES